MFSFICFIIFVPLKGARHLYSKLLKNIDEEFIFFRTAAIYKPAT